MQKYEKTKDTGDVLGASIKLIKEIPPKKVVVKTKIKLPPPPKVENTATAVNVIEETTTPQPEPQKENWFIRFLKFIF